MFIKKVFFLFLISFFFINTNIFANNIVNNKNEIKNCCVDKYALSTWFAYVGMGFAWSKKAGIKNPDPSGWDVAIEGYDNDLLNSPCYFVGFGRKLFNYLSLDLSFICFNSFHYEKHQTGISPTPGFTGTIRTRYFDLDNQGLLLNLSLLKPCTGNIQIDFDKISLAPFAGGGIGIGFNQIFNFHTVASSTPNGGKTTTLEDPSFNLGFAWQLFTGISLFSKNNNLNFDIGYKYYNGSKFKSAKKILINTSGSEGTILVVKSWKGYLKTHQIFADFRFLF